MSKSKTLFHKPRWKGLAKIIRLDKPKNARKAAKKLLEQCKEAKKPSAVLRRAKALQEAANRARAAMKKKNLREKERKECEKIAEIYDKAADKAFALYHKKATKTISKPVKPTKLSKKELKRVLRRMEQRSLKAIKIDLAKDAKPAKTISQWLSSPNRYDLAGIDTKGAKLIIKTRNGKELKFKIKKKKTKKAKKKEEKPKKLTKQEVKKQEKKKEKKTKKTKSKSKSKGRTPKKEEILEKAREMYMKDMVKAGLPAITPEEKELIETGYFEEARRQLMQSEVTQISEEEMQYIRAMIEELEKYGYEVIPAK
ncbi:MAG: hypothetical protein DRJ03_12380 [Chloroflexi bacterium]|nr:MAG: hypothetical protein DRJ03_12380 [Chloroflexota bacterium]